MFFGLKIKQNKKKGIVLQTRRKKKGSFLINSKQYIRRISSVVSLKKASMTIEAALALPVFLLCTIMILSVIDMMNTYVKAQEKLYEQTRKAAVYAQIGSQETNISGSDYVEFYVPHIVSPKIKGPGYQSFLIVNHCKAHIWNGYHGENAQIGESDTQYVYVTESGSVYHKNRSCSHLNITIEQISSRQVTVQRNEDGSRYYACPICTKRMTKKELEQYQLYVTPYGDRFHISLTCSGLKRTIRVVPISQVGERTACSECGG